MLKKKIKTYRHAKQVSKTQKHNVPVAAIRHLTGAACGRAWSAWGRSLCTEVNCGDGPAAAAVVLEGRGEKGVESNLYWYLQARGPA